MSTMMTERQRILLETATTRDQAEALLRGLEDAKEVSERHLAELHQTDWLKSVTGKSSIDNAIASTRRMIETLNRSLAHLEKELSDEDLALLETADAGRSE